MMLGLTVSSFEGKLARASIGTVITTISTIVTVSATVKVPKYPA